MEVLLRRVRVREAEGGKREVTALLDRTKPLPCGNLGKGILAAVAKNGAAPTGIFSRFQATLAGTRPGF